MRSASVAAILHLTLPFCYTLYSVDLFASVAEHCGCEFECFDDVRRENLFEREDRE